VRVPGGFAVTAGAFRDALTRAGARDRLRAELGGLDRNDVAALRRAGRRCREIVYAAGLPPEAREEVLAAHAEMRRR
jgi:pyruvate,water dikinase